MSSLVSCIDIQLLMFHIQRESRPLGEPRRHAKHLNICTSHISQTTGADGAAVHVLRQSVFFSEISCFPATITDWLFMRTTVYSLMLPRQHWQAQWLPPVWGVSRSSPPTFCVCVYCSPCPLEDTCETKREEPVLFFLPASAVAPLFLSAN